MSDAQALVLAVWNGSRKADDAFLAACRQTGINPDELTQLRGELRRVSRGRERNVLLTAMTVGRRR